jgi:hypothetical protein
MRGRDILLFSMVFCSASRGIFIFSLVTVNNLFQEVFEDVVL